MKRAIIALAMLLIALASIGVAAAAYPPTNAANTSGNPAPHKLIGYAGKIIAVKPPGDWTLSGPVGSGPALIPLLPLTLPVFGTDVHIASSNETFMASDPANPLYFISGSNAVSRDFSSNGGQTWTVTAPSGIGDPVGTYDDAGNAYYGQLSTGTCPDPAEVSRSANGGTTWGSQVNALSDASPTDHFIDKPWMAADISAGSPFHGRIYVTGTSFYAPGCNLNAYVNSREVIAHSDNQGATWSASATLSDASHDQNQFTNPTVASDGTLYVSYQYQNCTYNCTSTIPMVQLLTKSTDGGVTFSPSMTITGQVITPTGAFSAGYQYLYAGSTSTAFRHNDQAIIGVSPTNPQHVYAVWTDGRFESTFVYSGITGHHADIVFSRSTDGGNSWSPVAKINDDNVQGKDQFFPWMTVGNDGTLHVSWMDRREAAVNGFPYREYYSQSTDEGQTWSANQPVGDVTNTPSGFIGDYSGIAVNADNSRVLPVWTDQRAGQGIYTDAGLISGGATPTPTTVPSNTPTLPPATNTPTAVPPTDTATAIPPSDTPVPPTQTPGGNTATPVPSNTPTAPPPTATTCGCSPTSTPTTGIPIATPTACTLTFTDVPVGSTFYPFIRCLACKGIISGYPDGTFKPGNDVTRGQLSKIVSNAAGFSDTQTTQMFQDVPVGSTFFQYVGRLASRGFIGGYACGTPPAGACVPPGNMPYFLPNANSTRGQISKIVSNAAGFNETPTGQQFQDVAPSNAFYAYIYRLVLHNVMSGYPCGTPPAGVCVPPGNRPYFLLSNNATRGQTSKIVSNTFFPECNPPDAATR